MVHHPNDKMGAAIKVRVEDFKAVRGRNVGIRAFRGAAVASFYRVATAGDARRFKNSVNSDGA